MRRDIGQTIMAAGMIDDTVAWILLSVVLGLASGGVVTVGTVLYSAGKILLFMLVSFTLGRVLLKQALDFIQDRVVGPDRLLTLVVASAFAWGAVAQAIEIEAVLGLIRAPWGEARFLEAFGFGLFAAGMDSYAPDEGKSLLRAARATFDTLRTYSARDWNEVEETRFDDPQQR